MTTPNLTKSPGQIAFEAYNESKGGLTYDGKPIPPWSSLTDAVGLAVRDGWEVAAHAVVDDYNAILNTLPDVLIHRARVATERHSGKSRETSLVLTWHSRIPMSPG